MSVRTLSRRLNGNKNLRIYCPECQDEMTLSNFHRMHASKQHGINSNLRCVFCMGQYNWNKGQKRNPRVTKHIVECLNRFVHLNTIRKQPVSQKTTGDSIGGDFCECRHFQFLPRQMVGRNRDRLSEYIGFYLSVFEKLDMWIGDGSGVRFDVRSGLNSDVYWIVQRFLQNDLRWYHLMVKHNAFETFVREMKRIEDHIVVLPFWCLCDGLKNDEGRKISHRHMILACDDSGLFERVWAEKVRLSSEKAKTCRKIKTPFHLVRTIAYVSNLKAACDPDDSQQREYSHFHINRPLSEHAIVFLCMLYKDGIKDLCIEQFRNRSVIDWEENAVLVRDSPTNYDKKWAVPMKYTGFKFLDCVIPVEKDLEPSDEETNVFVYLNADRKLYFRENKRLLDLTHEDWVAYQVRKGNTLRAIENDLYFYTAKQQNVMNQIKQMEERTRHRDDKRWGSVFSRLKDKISKLEKENNQLITRNTDLQAKLNVALSENMALERDIVLKLKLNPRHVNLEIER